MPTEPPPPSAWDPWWLAWILPVSTIVGVIGSASFYVTRRLLGGYIQGEMARVLKEKLTEFEEKIEAKFDTISQRVEERHDENKEEFDKLGRELDEVKQDVAYLSGRTRRPRG